MSHRYFIKLSYDGTNYHGWQIQPGDNTIQETLEKAFKTLLKENIDITGAGRTDAGVHAKEYYAHFDTLISPPELLNLNLVYKLNSILPYDIAVQEIFPVKADAHARFTAISRTYQYYICTKKDPFWHGRAWMLYQNPDMKKMIEASRLLLDYTDFSSFAKSNTQTKTNNCQLMSINWTKENHIIIFEIKADRFLRNMVRAIVGTIIDVGTDKISAVDFLTIINSKNRSLAGYSAPAHGLFLSEIEYPPEVFKFWQ